MQGGVRGRPLGQGRIGQRVDHDILHGCIESGDKPQSPQQRKWRIATRVARLAGRDHCGFKAPVSINEQ